MTDSDLLRRFTRSNDQPAFRELITRHVTLVYTSAVRLLNGDTHAAADVSQMVFIDLAQKARWLVDHPNLAGWLYASTRFAALNTIRREQRRLARERTAPAMPSADPNQPDWSAIRPVLDESLADLDERDREIIVRRFFGGQSHAAIGDQLAMTENAAQKAVTRALDQLHAALARRGITSTGTAVAATLTANVIAAPTQLAATIASAAMGSAATGATVAAVAAPLLKLALPMVAGVTLASMLGYWHGVADAASQAADEALDRDRQVAAATRQFEQRLRQESARASAAEAETVTLLQAIERARKEREAARLIAVTQPTPPAMPAAHPTQHAIKTGDTGAKIARTYAVSVQQLRAANPDVDFARLRVGQIIALPPEAIAPAP